MPSSRRYLSLGSLGVVLRRAVGVLVPWPWRACRLSSGSFGPSYPHVSSILYLGFPSGGASGLVVILKFHLLGIAAFVTNRTD